MQTQKRSTSGSIGSVSGLRVHKFTACLPTIDQLLSTVVYFGCLVEKRRSTPGQASLVQSWSPGGLCGRSAEKGSQSSDVDENRCHRRVLVRQGRILWSSVPGVTGSCVSPSSELCAAESGHMFAPHPLGLRACFYSLPRRPMRILYPVAPPEGDVPAHT